GPRSRCGRLFRRLGNARVFSRRAVASAERAQEKKTAEAGQRAQAALRLSTGRDVQYLAALALAFAENASRAQALAADLAKRFPEDTVVQFHYLPTIHAQLALSHNNSSQSIEALQDRKSTRLNSSHVAISYAVFCLKKNNIDYVLGSRQEMLVVVMDNVDRLDLKQHLLSFQLALLFMGMDVSFVILHICYETYELFE